MNQSIYSPDFTNKPAQQAANAWKELNWHDGLKIAGSDSGFCAYVAFLAGVAWTKKTQYDETDLERQLSSANDAIAYWQNQYKLQTDRLDRLMNQDAQGERLPSDFSQIGQDPDNKNGFPV